MSIGRGRRIKFPTDSRLDTRRLDAGSRLTNSQSESAIWVLLHPIPTRSQPLPRLAVAYHAAEFELRNYPSTAFSSAAAFATLPVAFKSWRAILIASTHSAAEDGAPLLLLPFDRERPELRSAAMLTFVLTM
jgi:hypothetical protein